MIYRQEDSEEMFQLLIRINTFGFGEFEQEYTQKTLEEIIRNKNIDARLVYLERKKNEL